MIFTLFLLFSCSATKFVPDNSYMLDKVEIRSADKDVDASQLYPYIRQKANSKWFSMFKIPLSAYALSGRDTTKWINRMLQKFGESPVVFDTLQARLSCDDLVKAMHNLGYMHAAVDMATATKGKKIRVLYTLKPGEPYRLGSVDYDIQDEGIAELLQMDNVSNRGLHAGDKFTLASLENERRRITTLLNDEGYYKFHKEFIQYSADTLPGDNDIALTLHLLKYRVRAADDETPHVRYWMRHVEFSSPDSTKLHLRPKVLREVSRLEPRKVYRASDLQQTYNNFSRLQAVQYTNIQFREVPGSDSLDCNINLRLNKPSAIIFQPEGTNTAGDLGAAASLIYTNRNLFHGSEQLSIQLRGAFEAITGLEGYQDQDYQEYSVETNLSFPRFLAPFLSRSFRRRQTASSELSLRWDLQNRPEFHRRVFSAAWRYRWSEPRHHTSYRLDLLDMNYVYMPWISATFRHDYLDSVSNRNAILKYNYEDLFIMKVGFGITYNNGVDAIRANIETSGNLLNAIAHTANFKKDEEGQYTLFNIAYAQYAKFDIDYTHLIAFDDHNSLALHGDFGIAYPYGNSTILPFEKRYFAGGPNSVRGWAVRELGPGKFKGRDGRIDFINQTGDMKLDLNVEYRTSLFWKFSGAAFIDAGNIWTLRNYPDQPGGQFKISEFYRQIAVAYGLGLRLNFGYFILRFDAGMKAINPSYDNDDEHYAIAHPKFSRDFTFHFAVGLPF